MIMNPDGVAQLQTRDTADMAVRERTPSNPDWMGWDGNESISHYGCRQRQQFAKSCKQLIPPPIYQVCIFSFLPCFLPCFILTQVTGRFVCVFCVFVSDGVDPPHPFRMHQGRVGGCCGRGEGSREDGRAEAEGQHRGHPGNNARLPAEDGKPYRLPRAAESGIARRDLSCIMLLLLMMMITISCH